MQLKKSNNGEERKRGGALLSACYIRANYQPCHLPSHVRPLTRPVESETCCQIAKQSYLFNYLMIYAINRKVFIEKRKDIFILISWYNGIAQDLRNVYLMLRHLAIICDANVAMETAIFSPWGRVTRIFVPLLLFFVCLSLRPLRIKYHPIFSSHILFRMYFGVS